MKEQLENETNFNKEFSYLAKTVEDRFNFWVNSLEKTFDGVDVLEFIRENACVDYELPKVKTSDRSNCLLKPVDGGGRLSEALGRIFNTVKINGVTTTGRMSVLFKALEVTGKSEEDLSMDEHPNAMRINVSGKALIELHAWTPTKRKIKALPATRLPIPEDVYFRIPPVVKAFLSPEPGKEMIGWHYDWTRRPNRYEMHRDNTPSPKAFFLAGMDCATWTIRESNGFDQLVIEVHEYRPRMSAVQYVINLL